MREFLWLTFWSTIYGLRNLAIFVVVVVAVTFAAVWLLSHAYVIMALVVMALIFMMGYWDARKRRDQPSRVRE